VRKRLEETAKAKKAKKGFMTPERKKKLRVSNGHVTIGTCTTASLSNVLNFLDFRELITF
jgi:hypothetical protein